MPAARDLRRLAAPLAHFATPLHKSYGLPRPLKVSFGKRLYYALEPDMSFLLDLFRKKDPSFYLDRAESALKKERWVDARDAAEDGLEKAEKAGIPDDKTYKELQGALKKARGGICALNREEAHYSAEAGELDRAQSLLQVAIENAPDERARKDLMREIERLERRSVHRERSRLAGQMGERKDLGTRAHTSAPIDQSGDMQAADSDLFEVYLAGLEPEVAEHYRQLGADFVRGYILLNEGDAKGANRLFQKVSAEGLPGVYLDFERARVASTLGMHREARSLISKVKAAIGYQMIYLTGNPSISAVDAETLLALGETEAALEVLKEGRALEPNNGELAELEISILAREKRFAEAEKAIEGELAKNAKNRQMYLFLYQMGMMQEAPEKAAQSLERGMTTCCVSGACGPQDTVIPRTLISHYMNREEKPTRIEELLGQLFMAQKGQGEWLDHFLRARFYKWQGRDELGRQNWEVAMAKCPPGSPDLKTVQALYGV